MTIVELGGDAYGFRHFHLESVGSTNEVLVEMAREGDPGHIWLTAGEQTRGKGSRGRGWRSIPGNLYASLLLRRPCEKPSQHQLTFVAAVAARAALAEVTDQKEEISLKWPNDVMVEGKKCGGILLESGDFDRSPYVIIGMGINCESFPEKTLHPSTCLKDEGFEIQPLALFDALASEMAKRLALWANGRNFEAIRTDWLAHAYGIGDKATVEIPGADTVQGRFATIDPQGYMMIETAGGEMQKISTADIFFASQPTRGE